MDKLEVAADKHQVDKLQVDKLQVDKLQVDKLRVDKHQVDRLLVVGLLEDKLLVVGLLEDKLLVVGLLLDKLREDMPLVVLVVAVVVGANQLEELDLGDSQALVVVDMLPEDIGLQAGEEASLVAKVIQMAGHPLEVDKQGLQKELQVVEELPLIYFLYFY